MKRIMLLLLLLPLFLQAQVNYVLNPSFEQHWRCPDNYDEIRFANHWSPIDTINTYPALHDTFGALYCTPDYINTCALGNSDVGAPNNARFYQYPRTGNGMAQVKMFEDPSSIASQRDYLQGRLYAPLTANKTYCITFFVNFEGNIAPIASTCAVDNIGAYLDNGSIDQDTGINYCGLPHPSIMPQVYTTTIIDDTVDWTMIQGSFVATGTEKFITIGNFFDNAHTNYISYSSSYVFSVYLIDDVSVIESNEVAHAGPDVAITYGDSVHIGTNEEGMPNTWYVVGDTTPIGYSGGIWVKPISTTSYVVEMDLCGHVTYDTMIVYVWPAGVKPVALTRELSIYPNPATTELTITSRDKITTISITNLLGQVMYTHEYNTPQVQIDVADLPKGIYFIKINGTEVRRFVKE